MVLLSGHSGFLGTHFLKVVGAKNVLKLGRSQDSDIFCDLNECIPEFQVDQKINRVIHAAGKAHLNFKKGLEFSDLYAVNYIGTLNLLKGLENAGLVPKQFVFISSVSVYCEKTAYSQSKLNAEKLVIDWCKKSSSNALVLRLPLIFGFDAPGNLGAMENSIKWGYYFGVGSGLAERSVVFIDDLVALLNGLSGEECGIHNIVSKNMSYLEVESIFAKKYNRKIRRLPSGLVKYLAKIGDWVPFFPINSYRLEKLETSLTFESSTYFSFK